MPLFAPLSQSERRSLRAAPAASTMQQLAALLQLHHVRVIDLFRALDKNADGQVTRQELAEALRSLGISASRDEVDELFDRIDADRSGGIVFRELQLALLAATREEPEGKHVATASRTASRSASRPGSRPASRPASRPTSRPSSRPQSRASSQPASPRWRSYENAYAEAATGLSGPGTLAGESGPADGAEGGTVGELSEAEASLLDEMVRVAVAEAAKDGLDTSGVTLLRVLSAYEMVLQRHGIVAIEDTVRATPARHARTPRPHATPARSRARAPMAARRWPRAR